MRTERQVEAIEAWSDPVARARLAWRGLRGFAQVVHRLASDAAEVPDPGSSWRPPEWLQPPLRACYPVRSNGPDNVAVTVDPDARSWLDQVFGSALPLIEGTVGVEAWLTSIPEPPAAPQPLQVEVHIGENRVGALEGAPAESYHADLDAANRRQEAPYVRGRLTLVKRESGYLLEIAAPL